MNNIQHSSASNEAYTPTNVVEAARATMGAIDLDPFSCAKANEVVQASAYFSEFALDREWFGRVFCNPPGGTLDRTTLEPGSGYSSAAVAWAYLLSEYLSGRVEQAVFVCFSLNTFQNSQQVPGMRFAPYMFPFCVPSSRLKFWSEARPIGTKNQPAQPNALIYLGDNVDAFVEHFSPLGQVRV
jgi:hypothetical protein